MYVENILIYGPYGFYCEIVNDEDMDCLTETIEYVLDGYSDSLPTDFWDWDTTTTRTRTGPNSFDIHIKKLVVEEETEQESADEADIPGNEKA